MMLRKEALPTIEEKIHGKKLTKRLTEAFGLSKERAKTEEEESELVALAARIQPDGGMPGDVEEERVPASILVLLHFLAEGHSWHGGTFCKHV